MAVFNNSLKAFPARVPSPPLKSPRFDPNTYMFTSPGGDHYTIVGAYDYILL